MMLNGYCFAFFGAILSGPIALLLRERTGCMITKADITCARDPLAIVVKRCLLSVARQRMARFAAERA